MTSQGLPNPADFGDSQFELRRLGAAFLAWLRHSVRDDPTADMLHRLAVALMENSWHSSAPGEGLRVFYTEARRCALAGKLDLAGKHYREWWMLACRFEAGDLDTVRRAVRRLKGPAAASFTKGQKSMARRQRALDAARKELEINKAGISANKLALLVSLETGIEAETVRRYFKRSPLLLEAIKSRRQGRMKS